MILINFPCPCCSLTADFGRLIKSGAGHFALSRLALLGRERKAVMVKAVSSARRTYLQVSRLVRRASGHHAGLGGARRCRTQVRFAPLLFRRLRHQSHRAQLRYVQSLQGRRGRPRLPMFLTSNRRCRCQKLRDSQTKRFPMLRPQRRPASPPGIAGSA